MMSSQINARLILILKEQGEPYGFYTHLQQQTGIEAKKWRGVANETQGASIEMIEAISRLSPQYAFWLTTGITDSVNGHVAPGNALIFPEKLYQRQIAAEEYFRIALDSAHNLEVTAKAAASNKGNLQKLYERVLAFSKYHESDLAIIANELADDANYHEFMRTFYQREADRMCFFKEVLTLEGEFWKEQMPHSDVDRDYDPRSRFRGLNNLFWSYPNVNTKR